MLKDRIKLVRGELSQRKFAEKLGVNTTRIVSLETGKVKRLTPDEMERIVHMGISRRWLLAGEGEMRRQPLQDTQNSAVSYAFRPEIYASAGAGYINENEALETIDIDEKIARRLGAGKEMEIIQVKGDSMLPKYSDGDLIFVDRRDRRFTSEGIYVLLYEGTLMVKYLMRIKNGLRIRSLNRALYDDIDFAFDEFSDNRILIIGRVRGAVTFAD